MVNVSGLGITFGFHRLLTHSSFKAKPLLRYIFTFFGSLALQGGPITWVATHRLHHRESDKELDPHTPNYSFLWSHLTWNFFHHPECSSIEKFRSLAPDLTNDPVMRFFNKYFFVIFLTVTALLFALGYAVGGPKLGISLVIWGGILRTVYMWHATWFVNSATHTWGYKNYDSGDLSRNTWWVALMAFGEGWHNNHHADPRSARHGHRWFELDVTFLLIQTFSRLGWINQIIHPKRKYGKLMPINVGNLVDLPELPKKEMPVV